MKMKRNEVIRMSNNEEIKSSHLRETMISIHCRFLNDECYEYRGKCSTCKIKKKVLMEEKLNEELELNKEIPNES